MSEKIEQIEHGDVKIRILRESCREVYAALQPPDATPYIVAPRQMEPDEIVAFYKKNAERLEGLAAKMRKRFQKSPSLRCSFQTGDVAYCMGRPFMLQVHPLGKRTRTTRSGMRGRVNVQYSVDTDVSLITLFVVKTKDYDQARAAFMVYGRTVILKNAEGMAQSCFKRIAPDKEPPKVNMRAIKGKFASYDEEHLWLSEDLVPYPVDCLVYAIWRELMPHATIPQAEVEEAFHAVLPGYERAGKLLADRAEPYSRQ